jgi:hypothetical protein
MPLLDFAADESFGQAPAAKSFDPLAKDNYYRQLDGEDKQ